MTNSHMAGIFSTNSPVQSNRHHLHQPSWKLILFCRKLRRPKVDTKDKPPHTETLRGKGAE